MEKDYLTLILTRDCKEGCPFCLVDKKGASMEPKTARRAVEFFLGLGGRNKTIKFFGGEPLLEFDLLEEVINHCERINVKADKKIDFILSTSGILLNRHICDFADLHEIELAIDSYHLKKINKDVFKRMLSLPFLTLTLNIAPESAAGFFGEFKKFYAQGFRRYNFLPSYYIKWPKKSIEELEVALKKIALFYQKTPGLYFKNSDSRGDVPLFNSCLTCDVTGDIYSSNLILLKSLSGIKDALFLGNIRDIKEEDLEPEQISLPVLIKECFSRQLLNDTREIDRRINSFVNSLRRPMEVADIKLGSSCNNHCKFCVRRVNRGGGYDKTTNEIKHNLLDAARDCDGVVFTGGEVTIRKDLYELVGYAKRLGYRRIQIQSNGRMLAYKPFCLQLIKAGANEFAIALHGHTRELHDYLTSSPGSFYQTLQAIKNIKESGIPVITNTVINKSNYRHLPQIAELLSGLSVNQLQFAFVHALGRAQENFDSIVPRFTMIMPYVKEGLDIGIRFGVKVMTEAIPYCLMRGYENYVAENIIPSVKIFELNNEVIDFDDIRPRFAKSKGPACKGCRFFNVCEGTWKEYAEKFNWDEFVPV